MRKPHRITRPVENRVKKAVQIAAIYQSAGAPPPPPEPEDEAPELELLDDDELEDDELELLLEELDDELLELEEDDDELEPLIGVAEASLEKALVPALFTAATL